MNSFRFRYLLAFSLFHVSSSWRRESQETFVTAWKQLGDLREPEKLRWWLCRISRNLTCDALRKQGREPIHKAEPLEEVEESAAAEPLPSDYTISREEEAILWRSIERIPESYREPLVLFYREHQSVENVAAALDLSEDAVKQRLSRGRKLLHEQVLAFVEGRWSGRAQEELSLLAWSRPCPRLPFQPRPQRSEWRRLKAA